MSPCILKRDTVNSCKNVSPQRRPAYLIGEVIAGEVRHGEAICLKWGSEFSKRGIDSRRICCVLRIQMSRSLVNRGSVYFITDSRQQLEIQPRVRLTFVTVR